jgi:predicted RNA binding protein YcfA (HicA-like mRNA interferase family)
VKVRDAIRLVESDGWRHVRTAGGPSQYPRGDFSVLLDVPVKVRPDKEFRGQVEEICGAESIERVAG